MIVCAACRVPSGKVYLGVRHYDFLMVNVCANPVFGDELRGEGVVQGFVNHKGKFLNREEALKAVKGSGQTFDPVRNVSKTELYSEGIY